MTLCASDLQLVQKLRDAPAYVWPVGVQVIQCLTTSPKRLPLLIPWLQAYLRLHATQGLHRVCLMLPRLFHDTERYDEALLQSLDPERVYIHRVAEDPGPIIKYTFWMHPYPLFNPEASSLMVIVSDDDIAYDAPLLTSLVDQTLTQRGVWAHAGFNLKSYLPSQASMEVFPVTRGSIQVVEGFGLVSLQVDLFSEPLCQVQRTVCELARPHAFCRLSDDLVISWALAKADIPCFTTQNTLPIRPFEYGEGADALHQGYGVNMYAKLIIPSFNLSKYAFCLDLWGQVLPLREALQKWFYYKEPRKKTVRYRHRP